MGTLHLKIRLHKRGFGLKKDCVICRGYTNVRDLCHGYKGYVSQKEMGLHSERNCFGKVIWG